MFLVAPNVIYGQKMLTFLKNKSSLCKNYISMFGMKMSISIRSFNN